MNKRQKKKLAKQYFNYYLDFFGPVQNETHRMAEKKLRDRNRYPKKFNIN